MSKRIYVKDIKVGDIVDGYPAKEGLGLRLPVIEVKVLTHSTAFTVAWGEGGGSVQWHLDNDEWVSIEDPADE